MHICIHAWNNNYSPTYTTSNLSRKWSNTCKTKLITQSYLIPKIEKSWPEKLCSFNHFLERNLTKKKKNRKIFDSNNTNFQSTIFNYHFYTLKVFVFPENLIKFSSSFPRKQINRLKIIHILHLQVFHYLNIL